MSGLGDLKDLPGDQDVIGFDVRAHQSSTIIMVVLWGTSPRLEVDSLRKCCALFPSIEYPVESLRPGSGSTPIGKRATAPSSGLLSSSISQDANQGPQRWKTCGDHTGAGPQTRPSVGW